MGISSGLRKALRTLVIERLAKRQAEWDATHQLDGAQGSTEHKLDWRTDTRVRPYQDIYLDKLPTWLWEGQPYALVVDILMDLRSMRRFSEGKVVDEFTGIYMMEQLCGRLLPGLATGEVSLTVWCMDNSAHVPVEKAREQSKRDRSHDLPPYPDTATITDNGLQLDDGTLLSRFSVDRLARNRTLRTKILEYAIDYLHRRADRWLPRCNTAIIFEHFEEGYRGLYRDKFGAICVLGPITGRGTVCRLPQMGEADMQCVHWATQLNRSMPVVVKSADGDFMPLLCHGSASMASVTENKDESFQVHRHPLIWLYFSKREKVATANIHRLTHFWYHEVRMYAVQFITVAGLLGCDYSRKLVFKQMNDNALLHYIIEHRDGIKQFGRGLGAFTAFVKAVYQSDWDHRMELATQSYEERRATNQKAKLYKPKMKTLKKDVVIEQFRELKFLRAYWTKKWASAEYADALRLDGLPFLSRPAPLP